ncbi:MAG: hypothetical protein EXS13_10150 [Planctomycetes bacterium]|nr:hypothetical protein [Planctomycetota bacterium]
MLADWRELRDVRAFIDEARALVAAAGLVIREESNLADFIRWATARAERIDPLRALREEVRDWGSNASRTS